MTQLECTHAASDRNPFVTLHERATTCDESTATSLFDPKSKVLLWALMKWGLRDCCLVPGNDPATTPAKDGMKPTKTK